MTHKFSFYKNRDTALIALLLFDKESSEPDSSRAAEAIYHHFPPRTLAIVAYVHVD